MPKKELCSGECLRRRFNIAPWGQRFFLMSFADFLLRGQSPAQAVRTTFSFAVWFAIGEFVANKITFAESWSIIWPLNGIAVALLIMRPRRSWFWILLGMEVGCQVGAELLQTPLLNSAMDRVCNLIEVGICAWLLPPFEDLEHWLQRPGLFGRFFAAGVLGPGLAALVAWAVHPDLQYESLGSAFQLWGLSDALGIGATLPLSIVIGSAQMRALIAPVALPRTLSIIVLVLGAAAIICSVSRFPLEIFMFPLLLLVDLTLGFAGSAVVMVGVMSIAVEFFTSGIGPFAAWPADSPIGGSLALKIFLGFNMLALFPASIIFTERRRTAAELLESNSELAQRARALESLKEMADAANRSKSEFLATMSHEIRTPLNGVLGMTTLLLDTPLNSEQRELAEITSSSGRTLLELINNILDVSKIEAGQLNLENTAFDLIEVVEAAADTVAVRAAEKGLDLIIDIEPTAPRRVVGDPTRIKQVLLNLLSNAVKFTSEGEVGLRMFATNANNGRTQLRFTVWDTGIGIPADRLSGLFTPFSQVDGSTTRKFGGTGLGLSIARQLARAMGGDISIASELGVGTTFDVTLNLALAITPGSSMLPNKNPNLCVQIACSNLRLAPVIQTLVSSVAGDIFVSASAQDALQDYIRRLSDGLPPTVLIVDDALQDDDAMWLGQEIRRVAAPPPVLILLRSLGSKPSKLSEELFDRTFSKPLKSQPLREALLQLTNASSSRPSPTPDVVSAESRRKLAIHVLVADDNAVNRMVVERMLKKLGATVHCVENGQLALQALEADVYDVVLMDCQMPEMDGYEATRRLRAAPARFKSQTVPVIALTANAFATDRDQCIAAGMNDFLSKPLDPARLEECLVRVLVDSDSPDQTVHVG